MNSRVSLTALAALVVAGACSTQASAQQVINLTVGASLPENFAPVSAIKNAVVPEINRRLAAGGKYKINWRETYGGQLYKSNATITSLQDGVADMGHVFVTVEGSRLPLSQASSYTPGVTGDYRLVMRAHNELMESFAPLKAEWDRYGIMFLSAQSADPVQLFTKFPVSSVADLKGRKVSAIGSLGSWLSALGGVPISSPLPTMYNDIKTGLSEGAMSVPTAIASVKVYEVAPNVTLLNMGTFCAGALGVSKASFNKLPAEVQNIVLEVGRGYSERVAEALDRDLAAALKVFREDGPKMNPPVKVTEPPEGDRMRMFKDMRNVPQAWVQQVEATGAPARQMLANYMDTLRKLGAKPLRDWDKELTP
jgi:TRAP-type C4-dicarboxylate transport system substrate-binding protein